MFDSETKWSIYELGKVISKCANKHKGLSFKQIAMLLFLFPN